MTDTPTSDDRRDDAFMAQAVAAAERSRLLAPPNPWVGSVVVAADGSTFEGSTRRPGGNHAEREALAAAGGQARGATLYVTLEPCSFTGRTGPCVDAIVEAEVGRVVVGVLDPDERVSGSGVAALRDAGIEVAVGPGAEGIEAQLGPYLKHRRTGRPFVLLKLAATIDGRTAAADGTSQWITGDVARLDAHRLRAESDAVLVGAGTVRDDDPRLTVRGIEAGDGAPPREPLRVVLGRAGPAAAIQPCVELSGDLGGVLDELGRRDVLQLLVEGGATVAGSFHRAGLVDRYVVYLAPALMGGDDGTPLLAGPGAATIDDLHRLQLDRSVKLGDDLRVDLTIR
ncbi:MAG: bifunctional diaminohydroxyphosphoribosylaminopyrimidine deaminase/5-amino-6-(5-phosphoribosylamino)uracil reductase RibD [Acidimicrobiales bacterium]